jgi:hypothetical protein
MLLRSISSEAIRAGLMRIGKRGIGPKQNEYVVQVKSEFRCVYEIGESPYCRVSKLLHSSSDSPRVMFRMSAISLNRGKVPSPAAPAVLILAAI